MVFGLINKARDLLSGAANKVSGRTDFLEAVAAATALTAAADGDVGDAEVMKALEIMQAHKVLSVAFTPSQIETTLNAMINRVKTGLPGRIGLYKEIEEIKSNADMAEIAYVTAVEVAAAEGGIDAKEQKVLDTIAGKLGIDPRKYDL